MRKYWIFVAALACFTLAVIVVPKLPAVRYWWQEATAPKFAYEPLCKKYYVLKWDGVWHGSKAEGPKQYQNYDQYLWHLEDSIAYLETGRRELFRKNDDHKHHRITRSKLGGYEIDNGYYATYASSISKIESMMVEKISERDRVAAILKLK